MPRKKKIAKPVETPVSIFGEAIKFATYQLREGMSEKKIVEELLIANDKFTPENIQFIMHRASLEIAGEYSRDRGSIIGLHVRRYNDHFKKEIENKHEKVQDFLLRKNLRLQSLLLCIDILFAKERVLQIHAKDTQIKIFNKLNAKIKERKIAYDLSTLTLEEKIDFLNLVTKAKRSSGEVFSVQTVEKQVAEDVEAEVTDVKNENIKLITNTNTLQEEEKKLPQKTVNDVFERMRQALEKKAHKDLVAKGAKDVAPNPIDLRIQDYTNGMQQLQDEQTHSQ